MKPEAQRIAIAEACGYLNPHQTKIGSFVASCGLNADGKYWGTLGIPDYLNSLDAMHEAEFATFTEGCIWSRYYMHLVEVCNAQIDDEKRNSPMSATAAQRAEAFLRTLNLWTE